MANKQSRFKEGELVWMYYKDAQNVTQCRPVIFLKLLDFNLSVQFCAVLDGETMVDIPTHHLEKIAEIPEEAQEVP